MKRRRSWIWPGASQRGGRAAHGTGGGKQRSRQEEEEKDWFANSENFRDPDVNQRLLLIQCSNGKVPNMKVAQLFKIYNFDVGQKFI